jgi:hypothetical protein
MRGTILRLYNNKSRAHYFGFYKTQVVLGKNRKSGFLVIFLGKTDKLVDKREKKECTKKGGRQIKSYQADG